MRPFEKYPGILLGYYDILNKFLDKTVRGEIIKEEQNFVKQKHICENIEEEGECNEENCEECKKSNEEVKELCKFVEYKFENVWVKNKIFRLLLIFSADSKEVLEMYQKG
ncbi:unnamed protein product [Meloidogyne enterolobii]|uniref:Uncharacterized protein n=1 Tax=Meloidogyne enterolobii TaxID=390850 RepID=A0ACB0YT88_MELEN